VTRRTMTTTRVVNGPGKPPVVLKAGESYTFTKNNSRWWVEANGLWYRISAGVLGDSRRTP
jgi:hypothetical protein